MQEVVAATKAIKHRGLKVNTMVDIGGEDAKVVFFDEEGHAAREEEKGVALKLKDEYLDKAVNLLGEGWLLPAEVASYYNCGVKNVIHQMTCLLTPEASGS